MNTLHDLLAQAFHDNHPGPEDPCPTCVQQADIAVEVFDAWSAARRQNDPDILRRESPTEEFERWFAAGTRHRTDLAPVDELRDVIARAEHDYHNCTVTWEEEAAYLKEWHLKSADAALTVLRHTLQQHPELIEELGWICVARTPVRRPVFAPPNDE